MKISKSARRDAKQLFRSCLINGMLEETRVLQTVELVIRQKPRGCVAILAHFQRLVKLELARRAATVVSAFALSPAFQENVKTNLLHAYGPGLNLSFSEDPALIGGMRIQVGSNVYDGSVQARLADLQESFS